MSNYAFSRFWLDLNLTMYTIVDVVFALKPSIDALSALLFLGEYRKNAEMTLKKLRWCFEELLPTQLASADLGPSTNAASTVSPMPNTSSWAN